MGNQIGRNRVFINCKPNTIVEEFVFYLMTGIKPDRKWKSSENENYNKILEEVQNKIIKNGLRHIKRTENKKKKKIIQF